MAYIPKKPESWPHSLRGHVLTCPKCTGEVVDPSTFIVASKAEINGFVIEWQCPNCGDHVARKVSGYDIHEQYEARRKQDLDRAADAYTDPATEEGYWPPSKRQTGRTTNQIKNCKKGGIFICRDRNHANLVCQMRKALGMSIDDVACYSVPYFFGGDFSRFQKCSEIILDHSIEPDDKMIAALEEARNKCCPHKPRPDWTQAEDNNLLYLRDRFGKSWKDTAAELTKRNIEGIKQGTHVRREHLECERRYLDVSLGRAKKIVMDEVKSGKFDEIMAKVKTRQLLKDVKKTSYPKNAYNADPLIAAAARYAAQDKINKQRLC